MTNIDHLSSISRYAEHEGIMGVRKLVHEGRPWAVGCDGTVVLAVPDPAAEALPTYDPGVAAVLTRTIHGPPGSYSREVILGDLWAWVGDATPDGYMPCPTCHGDPTSVQEECETCPGDGTHDCPDCDAGHECGTCDGSGQTKACQACESGRVPVVPEVGYVETAGSKRVYLGLNRLVRVLRALPPEVPSTTRITVSWTGEYDMIFFRPKDPGVEWAAIVMPYRSAKAMIASARACPDHEASAAQPAPGP